MVEPPQSNSEGGGVFLGGDYSCMIYSMVQLI